jgi:hypothetical protein
MSDRLLTNTELARMTERMNREAREIGQPEPFESTCEECGGTGEVRTMEPVYPDAGSPMADIGTRTCICRKRQEYE